MLKKALFFGFILSLAGCGGGSSGSSEGSVNGSVSGTVSDYHTGTPLEGVTISVSSQGNDGLSVVTTTSDADGSYHLDGIGVSERFILSANMSDHGEAWQVFSNSEGLVDVTLSPLVLRAHQHTTFDSATESTLSAEGYEVVTVPANSFVDQDGNAYNGQVSTRITLIDPSSDASIMPGDFVAMDEVSGETSNIESFGAVDIDFSDASGNLLQLQEGQNATISIPLASSVNPLSAPQTMPLYYFDEVSGYWIEDGEAELTLTSSGYVYQGQVSHFTTWNADMVYDTVNVIGCVENNDGEPVSGARVLASGRDYIGQSVEYSDDSGNFVLPVRRNSSVLVSSTSNAQSDTAIISTLSDEFTMSSCLVLAEGAATITLTWGQHPGDLDSHFFGPAEDNSLGFEIYFGNRTQEVAGTIFDLDVDDVTSYGPEVITAPDFPLEGIYRYVVHHFSGSSTMKDSPARVELNLAGEVTVFSALDADGEGESEYWHVFNLEVDSNGDVTVDPVQQFSNDLYSAEMSPFSSGVSTLSRRSSGEFSVVQKKVRKYYSVD